MDMRFQVGKGLKRKVLGSFMGAGIYTLFLIFPIPLVWLRVLLGSFSSSVVMACFLLDVITAGGMKRRLEELLTYSLILGGVMFCINRFVPFINGFIGMLSLAIGSYELIRQVQSKWQTQNTVITEAQVRDKENSISVKTLFDTGNGLVEPISGKPVCVIHNETAKRLWQDIDNKGFRAIPFHSVGCNKGILKGYPVEQIAVEYEGKRILVSDIYLAVMDGMPAGSGEYDMIMNPRLLSKRK
jgi:stage II sporulation protein GA (sporulation sigma-E factor processing peptidase)